MIYVRLIAGIYASLFEYLTRLNTPVAYYYLDDICEGNNLVHFDVPGKSKFQYQALDIGPSTLIRQSSYVKELIRYRTTSRRPLGFGERMRWLGASVGSLVRLLVHPMSLLG
ncbi:hypothetical protein F5X99DRAFT_398507 [Biscogniauxia marginata]|nr:hypothetical protein F5X99DRAFT_398507 [Biscogniauxia marginata]